MKMCQLVLRTNKYAKRLCPQQVVRARQCCPQHCRGCRSLNYRRGNQSEGGTWSIRHRSELDESPEKRGQW